MEVVSSSERSTAARLVIGWLNVSMIGMPTPYVWLAPSKIWVWKVWPGVSVRKLLAVVTFPLLPSLAVALTV